MAAPIRVGILNGSARQPYVGRYWHSSMNTAASAMVSVLAQPDSANLGPNLIVPAEGFHTTLFGTDSARTQPPFNTPVPTSAQLETFFAALDTLDVVWISSFSAIGTIITDSIQRDRLASFIRRKGFVSTHTNLADASWGAWDSIQGARLDNWGGAGGSGTLHLDTGHAGDPDLRFLNRGLPDTARVWEEWFSMAPEGDEIRARPGVKVTVSFDEDSFSAPGLAAMGDHPISWFRQFPEGGRFFYTALGHSASSYTGTNGTTPEAKSFLRRQLYNAILWAAGVDSSGVVVSTRPAGPVGAGNPLKAWVSGSRIHVRVAEETPFTVDIHALDGKRIASRRGARAGTLVFADIPPHAVYVITVTTSRSRASHRILIP
jgi:type 1 glutamine amidotransferase